MLNNTAEQWCNHIKNTYRRPVQKLRKKHQHLSICIIDILLSTGFITRASYTHAYTIHNKMMQHTISSVTKYSKLQFWYMTQHSSSSSTCYWLAVYRVGMLLHHNCKHCKINQNCSCMVISLSGATSVYNSRLTANCTTYLPLYHL